MLHPFAQPLNELTAEELDKRYSDLLNRFGIAKRMSMGESVINQFNLMLDSIEEEKYRRSMVDERPNGVILDTDPIEVPVFKRD